MKFSYHPGNHRHMIFVARRSSLNCLSCVLIFLTQVFAFSTARSDEGALRADAMKLFGVIHPAPEDQLSAPRAQLGQALFWDLRVSSNGKTACASCHMADEGGADRRRFSPDAKGKNTSRNSQTVFNAVLQPTLRWAGDRKSAAHQAEKSLTGSMGFSSAEAVVPLLDELGYQKSFQMAFPDEQEPVSPANYAKAIEAYEQTLLTAAPFDAFLAGNDASLDATQKQGLRLFIDKGCVNCHNGKLLGGESFEKFGVMKDYWVATSSEKQDVGRFDVTKDEADRYVFRVSMLRNIADTKPYFHDGSVAELKEAIQVMADVQLGNRLTEDEAAAIESFLKCLSGDVPRNYRQPSP
jgi:cytochrome c peroxidase